MTLESSTKVWRYMSFAKLVWMLQYKQLWFSRADLLDDKWEVMLDTNQLNSIINNRPETVTAEEVIDRTAEEIKVRREQTFINCWSASEYESHGLWRVFCPSSESVAIQTTLGRLRNSIGLPVLEVTYEPHQAEGEIPDTLKLVTQKRPMFKYEQEVRIVLLENFNNLKGESGNIIGAGVEWDPELHLENIWVHPEAQFWFMEIVTDTVRRLAPKLKNGNHPRVPWSKMNSKPPI